MEAKVMELVTESGQASQTVASEMKTDPSSFETER